MSYWTLIEIISTITGILCVYLQTKEKVLAWPFGIISVALAAAIFVKSQLYSDVILHVVFLILNVFGWYNWSKQTDLNDHIPVVQLSTRQRRYIVPVILLASFLWGYVVDRFTNADLPYFDSFTTVGSLFAQYLLAKKVIDNWLIWIAVDIVAVNVYLYKGLYYFSFLFAVYLILCISGWLKWKASLQTASAPE